MTTIPKIPALLLFLLIHCPILEAQALRVRLDGERLFVAAPQLHFLTDRVLERLHNGAAVPFHIQLVAVSNSGGKSIAEVSDLFVVSFDLWEERFSVVQSASPRRTVSHLSANSAEAWCLENLPLPVSALADEKPIILKLDIRADESADELAAENNPGISLSGLIEIFSRKSKEKPLRWFAVSDAIRLLDLRQKDPGVRPPAPKNQPQKPSVGKLRATAQRKVGIRK